MDHLVIPAADSPIDAESELDRLAARYRAAGGPGLRLLTRLGTSAEGLLERLPPPLRAGLGAATERALHMSMGAAERSRRLLPGGSERGMSALTSVLGAAGGFAGLPGALVELPATTTVLLRAVQGVAAQHGFDPSARNVQFDCIQVLAAAGPLAGDDGADLGFLSLRLTLTGPAMQRMIGTVAPRLAAALGQKLATQTVPVLGAVAGAGVNYTYSRYYQEMAHVHFGLRRLAIEADRPHDDLVAGLAARLASGRGARPANPGQA
ncbi:EcsC family protein [Pseudodonghicola flavimaris]|uniref:EcsC family protein n=1 Tax=Pseudodonghicola flavimaris TaxID=3050036 RepID=A0ABT7F3F8_9RHOB|nr:EcsC family protein [Pseudodonghicola flavimaris]MDK3019142.1 EcsC family protein [Pseudodonghicola flavimaris]